MATTTHRNTAERLGRWVGGWSRAYVHRERQAIGWLVAKGWPVGRARVLVVAAKFGLLALLLYVAFWFALAAVLLVFAAQHVYEPSHQNEEDEQPLSGLDELRQSPGYDPNVYNDSAHEMYEER